MKIKNYILLACASLLLVLPGYKANAQVTSAAVAADCISTTYPVGTYQRLVQAIGGQVCVKTQETSASGATDDGSNPDKIGCLAQVGGLASYTNGQRANVGCSNTGSLGVAIQNTSGGLSNLSVIGVQVASPTSQALGVEEGDRPFANITTLTTTVVKSGAGYIHSFCINTKGATANTATLYDNTAGSGTKIATIDTTVNVGCEILDMRFGTGLTVVTATGTAADLTISYR